ncbi:MAG: YceI family protein [Bacteroidetes bacterium]|nr:YceI family protein [Bacteroidota bacterium]
MKKIGLLVWLAFTTCQYVNAQLVWTADKRHSQVKFSVTHMTIANVDGKFAQFECTVASKDETFVDAQIFFSADAKSISTDDADRDNHLRGAEFFDAAKYPNLVFKGTSFKKVAAKKYKLTGDLTIKDVTKPVTFDVTFNGIMKDGFGTKKAGFRATTAINRLVYGLVWNKILDAGGLTVGNDVAITIDLELMEQ